MSAVPTLKRLEFTGSGWTETPLVEGIEELNIEYGIDNNSDGAPDAYTTDPAAFQLYLKGRFQWNKRTTAALKLAAEFYQQAVEKDPRYFDAACQALPKLRSLKV